MSVEINFTEGVVRATPIAGTVGADAISRFLGLSLNEWFYVAAIVYTIIQAALTIYKTIKKERRDDVLLKRGEPND